MKNNLKESNVLKDCTGVLIQIKGCKHYAFIRLLDDKEINSNYQIDVFTPTKNIQHDGLKKIREGMIVKYDLVIHDKGYDAKNVSVITEN